MHIYLTRENDALVKRWGKSFILSVSLQESKEFEKSSFEMFGMDAFLLCFNGDYLWIELERFARDRGEIKLPFYSFLDFAHNSVPALLSRLETQVTTILGFVRSPCKPTVLIN